MTDKLLKRIKTFRSLSDADEELLKKVLPEWITDDLDDYDLDDLVDFILFGENTKVFYDGVL